MDKNTRLFLTLEYAIPNAVLKWLAEGSIWAMNEREADVVMNNIKELLDEKPSQSKAWCYNLPRFRRVDFLNIYMIKIE